MMDDYGSIRIPASEVPQAKNWKVGGKYQLTTHVEQVGINKERDFSGDYDEPISLRSSKKHKPKYKTVLEFRIKEIAKKMK